jgi:hypothetical protein
MKEELVQLLCFWALSIVLFLFTTSNITETEFCLRLHVEHTQLGLIDRASPYLRTPGPTQDRTNFNDWTTEQVPPEDGDRIQSPKRCLF